MTQVVIENPIINSPFDEPARHFRFSDEGITNEIVDGRRISSYFVPIARPKKKKGAAQSALFDTEWTQDRIEENKLVNDIRRRVAMWRKGDLLHLIVEVTGEKKKDKAAKVATARTLWVPAINNHGGFGRWAFIEVADPWDAKNIIRANLLQGT